MQTKDMTQRVNEAREYYDAILTERIKAISERSEVPECQMKKINPADFIERNKYQKIRGYDYINIGHWIAERKTDDHTFLISPLDEIEETAAQISYKQGTKIERTLRASKCEIQPCSKETALDFFIRNHRQSAPQVKETAVIYCLVSGSEIVAVMFYDISNGAVRGEKTDYELVRLAISKGTRVHGAASKLQQACEDTIRAMGKTTIYSYSNATINSGAVYEKLGFIGQKINGGQPFVIMGDNSLTRLVNLYPYSTDRELAKRDELKTHIGGNKMWTKSI